MIPVDQTSLYCPNGPPGNCYNACIASILEIPLESLPNPSNHWTIDKPDWWPGYWRDIVKWLKDRNIALIEICEPDLFTDCYLIISGPSPRTKYILHAVVGFGEEIVHDPHPSKKGLAEGKRTYTYFVLIDPGRR